MTTNLSTSLVDIKTNTSKLFVESSPFTKTLEINVMSREIKLNSHNDSNPEEAFATFEATGSYEPGNSIKMTIEQVESLNEALSEWLRKNNQENSKG